MAMDICRLCLLHYSNCISIFSELSPKDVVEAISKHVGEVSESDPLPKQVCTDCWRKVDSFHQFHQNVQSAQASYLNGLVKFERENNFIDVPEPVLLNVDCNAVDSVDTLDSVDSLPSHTGIKTEYDAPKDAALFLDDFFEDKSNQSDNDNESDKFEEIPSKRGRPRKPGFTCDICQAILSSKQKILEHLHRHVRYMCPICNLRCATRKSLETHRKNDHKNDTAEKSRKQLEALEELTSVRLDDDEVHRTLEKYYESNCDHCSEQLMPSLGKTQAHYQDEHGMDGYIKCCELKLHTTADINDHILCHLYPEHFKCVVCGKFVKTVESQRSHISKHLVEIQTYPHMCIYCNKGFKQLDRMHVHIKYHHGVEESTKDSKLSKHTLADFFTMRCDLCDTKFESFQMAKAHYSKVHGVVGYLICCDKKFVKPKTVDDHFKWHINPDVFKCPHCNKSFESKMCYSAHMSKHKAFQEKKFLCSECGKAFLSNYYLKIHKKVHDKTSKKSLACPHCGKRYTSPKTLESHIEFIHNDDGESKGVICEFCGKQFISRASVVNHIQTVHRTEVTDDKMGQSERSQCTMCSASFINKYRLKKHIESIHLGKPVKCSLCDKVAPNPSALTCHMRSVHVAQSFQCHLCSKTFKAAVALKDHIATHTGEKLYKCSFCPEAFIWRPNMYSHQKKAHPDEWKSKQGREVKRSRSKYN